VRNFLLIVLASFVVYFSSWLVVYKAGINTLAIQSEDTVPAIFLPIEILTHRDLYLDKFYPMLISRYPQPDDKSHVLGLVPFYLRKAGNHYVSAFPIITPLLAIPVYVLPVVLHLPITWNNVIIFSHVASALIVAISGGFFYLLVKKHFHQSEKKSLLLTFIYLFGTINYALIAQALWQHGSLELFSILGLYFLFDALASFKTKLNLRKNLFLCGLFFGLACLARPTAALALIFAVVFLFLEFKQPLLAFTKTIVPLIFGVFVTATFFIWYNAKYYVSIANQGYSNQILKNWQFPFPQSFFGIWLSPSKGILIYSPIFLFMFVSLYLVLKKYSKENLKYLIFALLILLHTLIVSLWNQWYGGWSFGYRMSSDVILYMVLLLIPFLNSNLFYKYNRLFLVTLLFSVLVQVFGVVFFDGVWHAAYDKGFNNTSWLWSLKDSEVMFDMRRILVKLHLLTRACPQCQPL
jgi:hypothetical protein